MASIQLQGKGYPPFSPITDYLRHEMFNAVEDPKPSLADWIQEAEYCLVHAHIIKFITQPNEWKSIYIPNFVERTGIARSRIYNAIVYLHMNWRISARRQGEWGKPIETDEFIDVLTFDDYYKEIEPVTKVRHSLSKAIKDSIHEKYGHICVYCGDPSEHIDHVIPLFRGGDNDIENLVAACKPCNRAKGTKLLEELGWEMKDGQF